MIDVKWDDNAKSAVREFAEYVGQTKHCERYIERIVPKQTKTVADAYEENPHWRKHVNGNIYFRITYGSHWMMTSSEDVDSSLWALVCTREQFEAYVKEQEGEKWTHRFNRERCYIKVSEEDCEGFIVIATETDGYLLCKPEELKPIKPTLTKEQELAVIDFAEDVNELHITILCEEYIARHEII